jgi:opacity protein-like surface antigen
MKRIITSTIATLGLLASGAALAQQPYNTPWRGDFWGYLGASAGESKYRSSCNRTVTLFQCDAKDTGFKIYAGGKMNEVLGLEVGYTSFGTISVLGGETEAWAVPITLTAGIPIGNRFNVFAKGGGLYARTDVSVDLNDSLSERGSRNGWGWTYGAGATFAVTPNVHIRADFDRHKLDFVGGRRDIDMLSAGVQFRF